MGKKRNPTQTFMEVPTPATTEEGRKSQIGTAALQLIERRIYDGTANSTELGLALKYAMSHEKEELDKLREEVEWLKTRRKAVDDEKERRALYAQAIEAMASYTPHGPEDW